jgi:hypothetical protein
VDPRISTLDKIAEALDCELVDLFYSKESFAADVNKVVHDLKLNLSKLSSIDLNRICAKEAFIPPFHPFWEQYKVKNGKIHFE